MMNFANQRKSRLLVGLFCCLSLVSCQSNTETGDLKEDGSVRQDIVLSGKTQGTTYTIKYHHPDQRNLQSAVDSLLVAFDNSLSTYNPASLITELNTGREIVPDSFMLRCINESWKVYQATNGAFNPAIYPVIEYWGFGNERPAIIDSLEIDSLRAFIAFDTVLLRATHANGRFSLPEGFRIEFNAIAQGLSVDLVAELLEANGVVNYMVEIGGEVRTRGKNQNGLGWRMGIDKPEDGSNVHQVYKMIAMGTDPIGMATSGNYRKFVKIEGRKYYHTINPATGYPVQHNLLSVTVLAESAAAADGFATAFMVMGLPGMQAFLESNPGLDVAVMGIYADESGALKVWNNPKMAGYLNDQPS
jgi:thiamine biosynthesis lipoprotein